MHVAAENSKVDVFVAILNHGSDIRIKNKAYKTCFDVMRSVKDKLKISTMLQLNVASLEAYNCALWFVIVQEDGATDVDLFIKLLAMVEAYLVIPL